MLAADNSNLIILGAIAIFSAITAPVILNWMTTRDRAAVQQKQWDREDQVAAKAELVAQHAAEAAELLRQNQEKAAKLLADNNRAVASTAKDTGEQLQAIHTAVNSNLTVRMTETLNATQAQLALMERLIPDPTPAEEATMRQLEITIAELTAQLGDRNAPPPAP